MLEDMNAGSEQEPVQETIVENEPAKTEPEKAPDKPEVKSTREALTDALKTAKEPKEQPKAPENKTVEAAKPAEDAGKAVPKPVDAPQSWSPAMKAKFGTVEPELQKYLLQRENEVATKLRAHDEDRTMGKRMKEVISPYMHIIQAEGGTPDKAVSDLLNTAYVLRRGTPQQKAQAVAQVIRQFGVDLRHAGQPGQQQQPDIQALINQGVEKHLQTWQEKQQQEQLTSQINAFKADPAHPHFEQLQAHMSGLLSSGAASDLKDAYDQALRAHPVLHTEWLQQQTERKNAEIAKQNEAKRKAGSSLAGSPGKAAAAPAKNMTTREAIKAALAASRGGDA